MRFNKKRLLLAQLEANLSNSDVARLAGMTKQQYGKTLNRGTCQPATLARLAHALNVEPPELLEDEKEV